VTAAPLAVYALDAAGRFIELNPAGERLLARTAGELLGQPFSLIIAPRDLPAAQGLFERTTAGAAPEVGEELWIVRPSGEERLLSVTIAPMWEGGAIRGVHGIARDITDERERERHVRRVERLAGVGTLIAGVAHELNNPLSAVLGFTRLLLMDPRPDSEREDLETIARETERMAKIVSDLRLIARDTQEDTGRRQRVDLNDVVRHVLRTRDYSLRTRNIEVGEELADGLPPLLADRGQLEQVLLNLVVNAEQAMDGAPGERTWWCAPAPPPAAPRCRWWTAGGGSPRRTWSASSTPSSPPRRRARARGWGCRWCTASSASTGRHPRGQRAGPGHRHPHRPSRGTAGKRNGDGSRTPRPRRPPPARPGGGRRGRRAPRGRPHPAAPRPPRGRSRRGHPGPADAGRRGLRRDRLRPAHAGMSGDELLSRLRERSGGIEQRLIFLTGDTASPEAVRILAGADVPILPKPAAIAEVVRWVEQVGAR
jgi:two-component system NtrC family sensor kinase